MVNHFEFHSLISNKANLFMNMMQYAETKEENVFKYLPLTILFDYNKESFFNKAERFEFLFKNIERFVVGFYEMDEKKGGTWKSRIYSSLFPF